MNIPSRIEPLESRIAPANAATIDLADLDGTYGFKISGEPVPHEYGGQTVQGLGDVNGDDFADFIINAPNRRECYVVFGTVSGVPTNFDLGTLDGANGFKI